jgi:hypothetical protein
VNKNLMRLKKYRVFQSSIKDALEPLLPSNRASFIRHAYRLAKIRYQKEIELEEGYKRVPIIRRDRIAYRKDATALKNFILDLRDNPRLMKWPEVKEAVEKLRLVYDDIGFLMAMAVVSMHPKDQTDVEKKHRAHYGKHRFLVSVENRKNIKLKSALLDYRLVRSLYESLVKFGGKSISALQRYGIITRVCLDALEMTYPPVTVKKAHQRSEKRNLAIWT